MVLIFSGYSSSSFCFFVSSLDISSARICKLWYPWSPVNEFAFLVFTINENIFYRSNNNSLILLNIETLPNIYQKKLLNFLENKKFFEDLDIKLNHKIITITEKNLEIEIEKVNFIKRLYDRISTDFIKFSSLSERRDDVLPILNFYLNEKSGGNLNFKFSSKALTKLQMYDWPGNISQLINYVEKSLILNQDQNIKELEVDDLALQMGDETASNSSNNSLDLSLKEAVLGIQKKIKIPSYRQCSDCNGSGAAKGSRPVTCINCNGSGQVRMQQGFFSVQQTCSVCSGTGQVIKDKCRTCNGVGAIKENKTLSVNIPAGVDNGDKVRLSGEGEWQKGGQSGDLYVAIRVNEDPIFERDGRHLYIEAPIPFEVSVIGGSIKIPTLEKTISLKIPSNTQTGKVFRIKGQGAAMVRDSRRGDILCRVVVETPSNLNKEQTKLLNELSKSLDQSKNYPGTDIFLKAISKIRD